MNNSKVAIGISKTVSIIQLLAGIAIVLFFGIPTIIYLTDKEWAAETGVAFFVFLLVFEALGVWLIILSRKKSKLISNFQKYVTAISHDPNGFIPDIAASLGASEDVVKRNLELMIKKRFFSNAFIDKNSNCIVIANKQVASTPTAVPNAFENSPVTPTYNTAASVEMVTVKCKGCGGINTIAKGQIGECDYCGSAIKGE